MMPTIVLRVLLLQVGAAAVLVPRGLDLYMPVPDENPLRTDQIALGRQLFMDRRLSRDLSRSCASCHDPSRAFSGSQSVSVGVFGRAGRRNAPALINRGYGRAFFWDGRETSLEAQVLAPIRDPNEMDMTLGEASMRVNLPTSEIARALASFVRSILSGNSRFDRFVNGERDALSDAERRGLELFRTKGNCTACHIGPNFTDERTHNTGVAWRRSTRTFADLGRYEVTGAEADRGAFKTPTLRDIARTAPYMHDGSLATLDDVVAFYEAGGRSNPHLDDEMRAVRLTSADRRNLVQFLRTLTGEELDRRADKTRELR
jgi:cytochrome c peroxidase